MLAWTWFDLSNMVLTFESVHEIHLWPIKWTATEQYAPVVVFIMMYRTVFTFAFVGEIKVWQFIWKLLSSSFLWYCLLCCTRWFYLLSLWMKSWSVTIQMNATEQYFPVVLFIMLYKVVLSFESVDEILKCDHSNESK